MFRSYNTEQRCCPLWMSLSNYAQVCGCISRSWVFNYLHIPRTDWWKTSVDTPFYSYQGQRQNQWLLWTARLGPCSVVLQVTVWIQLGWKGTAHRLGSLPRSQHGHGSQSLQDIHTSKPASARTQRSPTTPKHARAAAHTTQVYHRAHSSPLPCGIRPCFCLKLPMFL